MARDIPLKIKQSYHPAAIFRFVIMITTIQTTTTMKRIKAKPRRSGPSFWKLVGSAANAQPVFHPSLRKQRGVGGESQRTGWRGRTTRVRHFIRQSEFQNPKSKIIITIRVRQHSISFLHLIGLILLQSCSISLTILSLPRLKTSYEFHYP